MPRNPSARIGSINLTGEYSPHGPVPSVSVEQLHEYSSSGEDFFLLDVRKSDEYDAGHVSFVDMLIPGDSLEQFLHLLPLDRSTYIFCICRRGHRSKFTTRQILMKGYHNVFNVTGGMEAWQRAGYVVTIESKA